MKIIETHKLGPTSLNPTERAWVYNGLDACVTAEVLEVLLPQLDSRTSATYAFSKALQGPVLDMRLRGVRIDMVRRAEVVEEYYQTLDRLELNLERIVREGCDFVGFNWRSPKDLNRLFYNIYQVPPIINRKTGSATVNRDALEKIAEWDIAKPVVAHLTEMRDIKKRMDVVKTEVDHDGRIRTSYNIGGTNSGRFSSSLSEFGTGGNLQNIEESLRQIFIADEGMKLANFDAEQGESRVVGAIEWNLFHKGDYLNACETGDLHTMVSKLCEPDYGWTGDLDKDREIAEKPYYRHHSLRKLCKSIGHGSNYMGKAVTLSTLYKIEIPAIIAFQSRYFKAFPAHEMWWDWVGEQIRSHGLLVSFAGRKRCFFGRRDSDDVLREAIAYDPQGSLADIVNQGMIRVWLANDCQLLMQNHDSILVQYPQEEEDEIVPKIQKWLYHEIPLKHDRTLTIPYGCKTGWNWGEFSEANPDGLKKYKPGDKRTRTPQVSLLDRRVR